MMTDRSESEENRPTVPLPTDANAPTEGMAAFLSMMQDDGTVTTARATYRLRRRLGRGGFGSVYLASRIDGDERIPSLVAVKLYHAEFAERAGDLLRRELSALLAVKSPRVPTLHDWDLHAERPVLVMQYYSRGHLEAASGLPLDIENARRLLEHLLEALVVTHRAGLLHLDIKPGNVLMDDEGGFVLTDFGISQALLAPGSVVAPGLGTPGWQTPEQRHRILDAIDARTDLYGAGATVWGMLAGTDLSRTIDAMPLPAAGSGLPDICEVRPDVPVSLLRTLSVLLARDRAARPGSAAEALAMLRTTVETGITPVLTPDIEAAAPVLRAEDVDSVVANLVDPLWSSLARSRSFRRSIVGFRDGEVIGAEGDNDFRAFVLLSGRVEISRGGERITVEEREGTILGEVAALAGLPRTATMRALTPVVAAALNAAELESLAARQPALGVRLLKSLAERLAREGGRA